MTRKRRYYTPGGRRKAIAGRMFLTFGVVAIIAAAILLWEMAG